MPHPRIRKDLLNVFGMILNRADYAPHTGVSPDDRGIRMAPENDLHLLQVRRLQAFANGVWSVAYMSVGLKPVIIGSKRARSLSGSER